ncbi:4-hydroxy-tetrahydrodipicolinate synthase [Clostridium taeniosporum]|uniref:4-hydroxy-tetrahydrodipicolinate synthase n=1 Tax=Clostridium taeniosporum TaxID=394958 RepID=A0A1D7XN81_9CLOT|nr:4-hydroxy-tetrahydrodipicolinate synthase [Clostridium taeniosporum]AOR24803.1 4-hydroxy-tetrahydrodipicolinate synthase [Clostridium taeniosporum]
MKIKGVIIPLVTPFKDNCVDFVCYKKLVDYYIEKGVDGIIPLGTTGESSTISSFEYNEVLSKTMEYNNGRTKVYVGLGGNNTLDVIKKLKIAEDNKVNGILSVAPYYSRPNQRGIYEHFKSISESTDMNILMYNIPYRTGVNIENETIYKLAELKNIIGIKDCSGNINQTSELLLNRPNDNFSILTGEDALFYTTLALGGDGGILASASLNTESFIKIYDYIQNNNHKEALKIWSDISKFIPLLFQEPNPTPLKYCLKKIGLIDSDEVRLPLTNITDKLKEKLDNMLFL